MAVLIAVAIYLLGILSKAISSQLTNEFKAWCPLLVRHILGRAIARLPKRQQSRFSEEWTSHCNEVPGEIGKIFFALGCLMAAYRMVPLFEGTRKQGSSLIIIRRNPIQWFALAVFAFVLALSLYQNIEIHRMRSEVTFGQLENMRLQPAWTSPSR
jgi:hypothetical protein